MAYVMYKYRCTLSESARLVKTQRFKICPNYGFVDQLVAFEKRLGIKGKELKKKESKGRKSKKTSEADPPLSPFLAFIANYVKMPLVTEVDFLKSYYYEPSE